MEGGALPRSPQMIEKIGGRGGTRTRGPLLAKQAGQILTALSGVAYTENQRNFRSLKCPEVVPSYAPQ